MEVEIKFQPPLRTGVLLGRRKRFFADVRCDDGETITALCPNTGSMKSCCESGRPVALSYHPETTRRHPYTWEMIKMDAGWVGVNTALPNNLVALAVQYGMIPELISFTKVRREVPCGLNSRIDFLLEGPPGLCYLEVKNVSLVEGKTAYFPDAVSERATRHLEELMRVQKEGHRAVMMFVIQRPDGQIFRPADHIDPVYGKTLRQAAAAGVETLCYRASVSPLGVTWGKDVPKDLPEFPT
jgi:sugar fermentation stimulation protein A